MVSKWRRRYSWEPNPNVAAAADEDWAMILVVDDDISVTTSLSLLLKQAGYQTATAASLAEVLYRE